MIDRLLEGNRLFVEKEFNHHLDYYRDIAQALHPEVLWIGCSDSRVPEDVITDGLLISGGAKEKVERMASERPLSRAQRLNLLSEENVRLQIKHPNHFSQIRNRRRRGDPPRIHGWIHSMESGRIKVLVDGRNQQLNLNER